MIDRMYEAADLADVMETYTASIHSLGAAYYSPEQLDAWAPIPPDANRWKARLSNLRTVVAELNGAFAGFASYTPDGYLDFLFTHPAFTRCGVGSRLYHRVESALHMAKAARITTHASLAARAFFERKGFLVDQEERTECRGVYLRRFAMHKPLCGDTQTHSALGSV